MRAAAEATCGVGLALLLLGMLPCRSVDASQHSNNWAVLVDTSRYWYNYRHVANALSFYNAVKQAGIPDSQIILMLADDMACNPRNAYPAQIFNRRDHKLDLYGDDVEVDFRSTDVTVENFIRVLTGRHHESTPRNKRLLSDENSNILIFMTGHGGDEFLKFQDQEEISSQDLADAFEQMRIQRRFNEILFAVDTCQASTLDNRFRVPGIVSIGSSAKGENSYSHHADSSLGVSVIDRFTYYALEFLQKHIHKPVDQQPTIKHLFDQFSFAQLRSNAEYRDDLMQRPIDKIPLGDFFSAVVPVFRTPYTYELERHSSLDASEQLHEYTYKREEPASPTLQSEASVEGVAWSSTALLTMLLSTLTLSVVADVSWSRHRRHNAM